MKRLLILPAVLVAGSIATVAAVASLGDGRKDGVASETPAVEKPQTAQSSDGRFSPFVDREGNISLPKDYKRTWAHLGNWAVAKKSGDAIHEIHNVYTQPETIDAFNKNGLFPDGAVLVKEVRNARVDGLTTGHAAWSTDTKIWFVLIKDRKGRFKESEHWGDGWGWALFEAKDPSKNVSVGYETSCISCHIPAEDTDWVYTYAYPDLNETDQQ